MKTLTQVEATTLLAQNPDIMAAELGDETVMMSLARNNYYGLDEVGSRIWALLAQPRTVAEICALLLQEFAVDPDLCEREVTTLVQQLANEQLVTVAA